MNHRKTEVADNRPPFLSYYGFRINRFNPNATNVKVSNIIKVAVYPPVTSNILLDRVAIKDPAITVNVISAIFVEKYFIPKKEEVKAAVMVGQAP